MDNAEVSLGIEIGKDGQKIADRYVPYAVIPPHEVRDKANNPFGVMTHFAQGWDNDSLEEYDSNDYEFAATPTKDGAKVFSLYDPEGISAGNYLENIRAVIYNSDNRITYQVAIPWKEISPLRPVIGRMFGFNFMVSGKDHDGRISQMKLSPKHPHAFKKMGSR